MLEYYYKLKVTWLIKVVKNWKGGMGTFVFKMAVIKDKRQAVD